MVVPVALAQFKSTGPMMVAYWREGFPPGNPFGFLWWLILTHTGNLFAYPFGGNNGASTLNFVVAIVGLVVLNRTRPRPIVWLLVLPFVITFIAAVMHRYPYGHAERISQHLAPAAILLIGIGTAVLVQRIGNLNRRMSERAIFIVLLLIGGGVLLKTVLHPYSSLDVLAARKETRDLLKAAGSGGTIAMMQPRGEIQDIFSGICMREFAYCL